MFFGQVVENMVNQSCAMLLENHAHDNKQKIPDAIIDIIGKYVIFQIAFENKGANTKAIGKKMFHDVSTEDSNDLSYRNFSQTPYSEIHVER